MRIGQTLGLVEYEYQSRKLIIDERHYQNDTMAYVISQLWSKNWPFIRKGSAAALQQNADEGAYLPMICGISEEYTLGGKYEME